MSQKELLFSLTKKDFKIDYFSGTGAGGQYRNKHQNSVRLHHPESGAMATGQSHRERPANLKEAFDGLINSPKFKMWHSAKVQEALTGLSIRDRVEQSMQAENLKIEGRAEGIWKELTQNDLCEDVA